MASRAEVQKAKDVADHLRKYVFIGIEATSKEESAAKAASGGSQQPRRERLLNMLSVMERDDSKSSGGNAKPRMLCITVKRNRKIRLHKVKMNGTAAEISKVWGLDDIRSIEFKEPNRFSMHINHKYIFTAADTVLIEVFLQMLVKFCNKYAVKPPKYINTVSGAMPVSSSGVVAVGGGGGGGAASGSSMGTMRPRTVFNRGAGGPHTAPGTQQAKPPIPNFEPSHYQQSGMIMDGSMADMPIQRRAQGRGGAGGGRGPNEQGALIRRMTKYVADHGGDVSKLVPMGAPPMPEELDNNANINSAATAGTAGDVGAGGANAMDYTNGMEEELEDVEEMLLDEAFMLSADELVGDFGWRANIDAAQLESRLLDELHKLESENVRDMMEADKQVPSLIKELDHAINHLEQMEEMLKFYSHELESMDDDVRKIQMENETLKIEEANQQRLLLELDKILKNITLSEDELQILRNESLETNDGIERVERVAASLKRMLGTTPGYGLGGMEATHEKMKKYEFYSANFSTRVYDYLKVMFQFKIDGSVTEKSRSQYKGLYLISGPEQVHKIIIKYAGLTLWLKETKPSTDKELQALYIQCMNVLYANQTKELVDSARPAFFKYRHEAAAGSSGGGVHPLTEFSFSTNFGTSGPGSSGGASGGSSRRISLDGISGAAHHVISSAVSKGDPSQISGLGGGGGVQSGLQPAEAFAIALENVVSNVISEQNFISDLFHYVPNVHTRAARRQKPQSSGRRGSRMSNGLMEESGLNPGENISFYAWVTQHIRPIEHWDVPRLKLDSKDIVTQTVHFGSVKEVKSMLDLLFGALVTQVDAMIDMGTRFDPSQAIGMLVSVSSAIDRCQGSDQGFLINLLERCSDKLENIFQRYINEQARAIEATKMVTKKRVGALPFARIFPKFIAHIEDLVGDTGFGARTIADNAYSRMSRLIFDTLEAQLQEAERNAKKNADDKDAQKEQLNTHVLLLENMFVLVNGLQAYRQQRCRPYFTPTLDTYLDHAHIVQRKVMRAYIKDVLQRPMGRLIAFFDAVERCLAANRDPLTTQSLSKSHLKKVIQWHSSSTMRENIKQLSKRVEKHFLEEPKLRPIVWQAITDDMLSNYQRFVTLLARAYKSTNMSLDFTQSDLTRWLSER